MSCLHSSVFLRCWSASPVKHSSVIVRSSRYLKISDITMRSFICRTNNKDLILVEIVFNRLIHEIFICRSALKKKILWQEFGTLFICIISFFNVASGPLHLSNPLILICAWDVCHMILKLSTYPNHYKILQCPLHYHVLYIKLSASNALTSPYASNLSIAFDLWLAIFRLVKCSTVSYHLINGVLGWISLYVANN